MTNFGPRGPARPCAAPFRAVGRRGAIRPYGAPGGEKASRNGQFALVATSRDGSRRGARRGRDRAVDGPGWQSRGKNGVTWRRDEGPIAAAWPAVRSLVLP